MPKHQRYPLKSNNRSPEMGSFTFTTNNTTDPTTWDDMDSGIVSSIAYSATGIFTVTLSDKFRKLQAIAQSQDFANTQATVTGTSAANGTITVQSSDHADPQAAETSTSKVITVFYSCVH
jgi:hypothetical protein